MDSLESVNSLDSTHGRRHTYWFWDAVHLHALLQLLDRCLPSCVSLIICHAAHKLRYKLTSLISALLRLSQLISCSGL